MAIDHNNEAMATASPSVSITTEVERSRAVQEVQAALVMAKRFPRDTNAAFAKIVESCKRLGLAKTAIFSLPRGGQTVTGASIRLAEVMAQCWGNLDFGVVELERRDKVSVAESYCWDLESNTRQKKRFEVPHSIQLKAGTMKVLTDPVQIYEMVANMGARRLRACILGIIPPDIREAAEDQCRRTLAAGDGEPLADRIRRAVVAFKQFGVSQEMIEIRLGHKIDLTVGDELVELQGIYNAIKEKQAKRGDFFDFPDDAPVEGKAAELSAKLRQAPEGKA